MTDLNLIVMLCEFPDLTFGEAARIVEGLPELLIVQEEVAEAGGETGRSKIVIQRLGEVPEFGVRERLRAAVEANLDVLFN